ncbi:MAG: NUDIX domain-containing protein [Verrucomicrobia bacterium]|nr:NUDIX domain-containing protein [Verrucomicrobiota bacterium]
MKVSAGLLMYRVRAGAVEVMLVHPGGPFWVRKDEGAWSIPKGGVAAGEDLLATACREFREETGLDPAGPFIALEPIRQKGGKLVHAWAFSGDCQRVPAGSHTFNLEWPPGSGRLRTFPEIDRVAFYPLAMARRKVNPAQIEFLDQLERLLNVLRDQAHPDEPASLPADP